MFGLSASHMIVVGVVVLLFGPKRLPELGSSFGKAIRAFKNATDGSLLGEDRDPPRRQIPSAPEMPKT